MIRRVVLAFLAFGLVACGDDGIGPEDIVSTYTSDTQNGEEFGYTFQSLNSDGSVSVTEVTAEHIVLGPQSSCEVNLMSETTVYFFNQLVDQRSMTVTRLCTFVFNNGALTLNYTDGNVDTGSIVGSTLTITEVGSIGV